MRKKKEEGEDRRNKCNVYVRLFPKRDAVRYAKGREITRNRL